MIDVIIPTIPDRAESLDRLISSLEKTAPDSLNIFVVNDSTTCGAGWREGMEATGHDYVLLACDDQEFLTPGWDVNCIEAADKGKLVCPRVWLPDGSIESQGGDMEALRHVNVMPRKDWSPVDYTTVPFMSRAHADAIGMHDWHYCTDVWISYRGRQLGIETVLRHGFDVRHYHEAAGRGAGMTQTERDEMDEAAMRKELAKCGFS